MLFTTSSTARMFRTTQLTFFNGYFFQPSEEKNSSDHLDHPKNCPAFWSLIQGHGQLAPQFFDWSYDSMKPPLLPWGLGITSQSKDQKQLALRDTRSLEWSFRFVLYSLFRCIYITYVTTRNTRVHANFSILQPLYNTGLLLCNLMTYYQQNLSHTEEMQTFIDTNISDLYPFW